MAIRDLRDHDHVSDMLAVIVEPIDSTTFEVTDYTAVSDCDAMRATLQALITLRAAAKDTSDVFVLVGGITRSADGRRIVLGPHTRALPWNKGMLTMPVLHQIEEPASDLAHPRPRRIGPVAVVAHARHAARACSAAARHAARARRPSAAARPREPAAHSLGAVQPGAAAALPPPEAATSSPRARSSQSSATTSPRPRTVR